MGSASARLPFFFQLHSTPQLSIYLIRSRSEAAALAMRIPPRLILLPCVDPAKYPLPASLRDRSRHCLRRLLVCQSPANWLAPRSWPQLGCASEAGLPLLFSHLYLHYPALELGPMASVPQLLSALAFPFSFVCRDSCTLSSFPRARWTPLGPLPARSIPGSTPGPTLGTLTYLLQLIPTYPN